MNSHDDEVNAAFVQGKRIVVVEDNTQLSEALSKALEMLGGKVECFDYAEQALLHPEIGNADCYIVDYRLNGTINGINFLSLLHQKLRKPICAVMISGDTSANLARKAELFDWPMLHKPVNLTKLISMLSEQYKRSGRWLNNQNP